MLGRNAAESCPAKSSRRKEQQTKCSAGASAWNYAFERLPLSVAINDSSYRLGSCVVLEQLYRRPQCLALMGKVMSFQMLLSVPKTTLVPGLLSPSQQLLHLPQLALWRLHVCACRSCSGKPASSKRRKTFSKIAWWRLQRQRALPRDPFSSSNERWRLPGVRHHLNKDLAAYAWRRI